MASAAAELLRRQLREKFPQAHVLRPEPKVSVVGREPFAMETFRVETI